MRLTPVYSTDQPVEKLIYEQDDLDTIELPARPYQTYVSVSIKAKGKGTLFIGAIHKGHAWN